jgi:TonB family protein
VTSLALVMRLEPMFGPSLLASPAGAGADGSLGPGGILRADGLRGGSERRNDDSWRLRGPIASLLLHLLVLLLVVFEWPSSPPPELNPIPVQLVMEPPKAEPAPPPAPQKLAPRPRGRVASEDLGDPEDKQTERSTERPAPEKPQQTVAAMPPLPAPKPDTAKAEPSAKPPARPTLAAHQAPRRVEPPVNPVAPHAKFPGPAATRDEYLAYMHALIRQHYNLLPAPLVGGRRGMTVIEFVVLDDGKIALLKVRQSSGYPDIDNRVAEMVAAVGRFPPLPQWFQGVGMPFEFGFPFPEALRE